jgi:hypothetical protein
VSLAILGQRGPRLVLVNVVTGERLTASAHPPSFGWTTAVSWPRHEVPGRIGSPLQYGLTQNAQVQALELTFDRRLPESDGGTADLPAAQKFLGSLTTPTPVTKAPPRVLLVWPNLVTFEAVVTSVTYEHREIAVDGRPLLLVATLSLEGVPRSRRGDDLAGGRA